MSSSGEKIDFPKKQQQQYNKKKQENGKAHQKPAPKAFYSIKT